MIDHAGGALLGIEDFGLSLAPELEDLAAITDLTARLGVKRRAVDDHDAALARGQAGGELRDDPETAVGTLREHVADTPLHLELLFGRLGRIQRRALALEDRPLDLARFENRGRECAHPLL